MNNVSDYIDFDFATATAKKIQIEKPVMSFYIIFSINVGLRYSDVITLKHTDMVEKNVNDTLILFEKKTSKKRVITLNKNIIEAYTILVESLNNVEKYNVNDFIFLSNKKSVFTNVSINMLLKKIFNKKKLNISSHSLRKSFGRKIYENNNQSEHSLVLLSDMFNHTSISITRRYLGLRSEEISNVYLSL